MHCKAFLFAFILSATLVNTAKLPNYIDDPVKVAKMMKLAEQGQGPLEFQMAHVITAGKIPEPLASSAKSFQDIATKRQAVARILSYAHNKASKMHAEILKCPENKLEETLNKFRSSADEFIKGLVLYPLKASLEDQTSTKTGTIDPSTAATLDNLIIRLKELYEEVSSQRNDALVAAFPDEAVVDFVEKSPDTPILNSFKGIKSLFGSGQGSSDDKKSAKIIDDAIAAVRKSNIDLNDAKAVQLELKKKLIDILLTDKKAYAKYSTSKLVKEAMIKMGFASGNVTSSVNSDADQNSTDGNSDDSSSEIGFESVSVDQSDESTSEGSVIEAANSQKTSENLLLPPTKPPKKVKITKITGHSEGEIASNAPNENPTSSHFNTSNTEHSEQQLKLDAQNISASKDNDFENEEEDDDQVGDSATVQITNNAVKNNNQSDTVPLYQQPLFIGLTIGILVLAIVATIYLLLNKTPENEEL